MIADERVRRRVAASTRFAEIVEFATVDSTNRWLLAQAGAGAAEGLVAVADHQDAGRGRRGRHWEAPAGSALLVSVLLRPVLAPADWHLVNSMVGLAARDALGEVAGFFPDLKWPNDLMVGDRKLAGLLSEAAGGALVVGLGCNVSWAPAGAVSAEEAAGRPLERGRLLEALLVAVEDWYGRPGDVSAAYRQACATLGRRVRVERPSGDLVGTAVDVDGSGRLVVRATGGVTEAVAVGDVVHLRPAPGRGH